jgi:alpha-tubulin suppressor-like RCC1 family protein
MTEYLVTLNEPGPYRIGVDYEIPTKSIQYGNIILDNINYMIGIKSNGTMWGWGLNTSGQLGLGNNTTYNTPQQIGTDTNWSSAQLSGAISQGSTIAMKTNGTIWSTGSGSQGSLGLGNNTTRNTFAQIGTSIWNQIQMSGFSSWGIKTDGTLWSWGANGQGQLGLGNTTSYNSPQQVGSDNNWSIISSIGYFYPKAIKMMSKPRHFHAAIPLLTTLLCVSKKEFFLKKLCRYFRNLLKTK